MKLFKVKNKFSGYGLVTYIVYAKNESEAIKLAGERLKEHALKTNFTFDEAAYTHLGLKVNDIFKCIDTENYYTYFKVLCLAEDIEEERVIELI